MEVWHFAKMHCAEENTFKQTLIFFKNMDRIIFSNKIYFLLFYLCRCT